MTPIHRPGESRETPRATMQPSRSYTAPLSREVSTSDVPTPVISNCRPTRVPPPMELSPPARVTRSKGTADQSTLREPSESMSRDIIAPGPPLVIDFTSAGGFGRTITGNASPLPQRGGKGYRYDNNEARTATATVRIGSVVDNLDGAIATSAVWIMGACMRRVQHSLHTGAWNRHRVPAPPRLAIQHHPARRAIPFEEDGNRRVHGIRNYGQTCFLNSVLQSLAVSEPFVVYLERVVEIYQERVDFESWKLQPVSDQDDATTLESLSGILLRILWEVNGCSKSDIIDPRAVLQAVGKENAQFRARYGSGRGSVGKEQQDAEELIQSLVGIIVEDANLHSASSVAPSLFTPSVVNLEDHEDNDDDDTVTIMTCLREKRQTEDAQLLRRVVNGSRSASFKDSPLIETNGHNGTAAISEHDKKMEERSTDYPTPSHQPEEKKQEEFELRSPHGNFTLEENIHPGVSMPLVRSPNAESLESLSDVSKESEMSNAMQIMMTTISSVSTSPFSGWMGSALQCRTCRHVRPIQNTPFFDIPIVPSAVSSYLSSYSNPAARGDPPRKYRQAGPGPPCTLEECLQEFTCVERVQDVECRCCTLKSETIDLEEDVDMLQGAYAATLARARRSRADVEDDDDEFKSLRDELRCAESKLAALRGSSPDDDGPLDALRAPVQDEFACGEATPARMMRGEALKCLLITRLPSVLCIHVQRRYYDPSANRMSKTLQHVIFPEYLNVAPYCAYSEFGSMNARWTGTVPERSSSGSRASIHYRLMSVIEHRGNAFHGHYVCYRRDPFTGRWLYISDEVVQSVSWQDVQRCQAYMLFYEAM